MKHLINYEIYYKRLDKVPVRVELVQQFLTKHPNLTAPSDYKEYKVSFSTWRTVNTLSKSLTIHRILHHHGKIM